MENYAEYSNKLANLKEISEKKYFQNEINNQKSNTKKLWENLHLVLGLPANKKQSRFNNVLNGLAYEGKIIENGFDIAGTFIK